MSEGNGMERMKLD